MTLAYVKLTIWTPNVMFCNWADVPNLKSSHVPSPSPTPPQRKRSDVDSEPLDFWSPKEWHTFQHLVVIICLSRVHAQMSPVAHWGLWEPQNEIISYNHMPYKPDLGGVKRVSLKLWCNKKPDLDHLLRSSDKEKIKCKQRGFTLFASFH